MRTDGSDPVDEPIFSPHEYSAVCFAQLHGARDDRVEHRLDVARSWTWTGCRSRTARPATPSTAYRSTRELHRLWTPDRSVMHREVELFPLPQHDRRIVGFAEPHRAPGDRVEDRLDVGGRARDDPQDFRRRRLLFQSLGQLLLKVAVPGAPVLRRLAGDGGLGFDLRLCGLWTPTSPCLL